jgi:hypothetical protein
MIMISLLDEQVMQLPDSRHTHTLATNTTTSKQHQQQQEQASENLTRNRSIIAAREKAEQNNMKHHDTHFPVPYFCFSYLALRHMYMYTKH